LNARDLMKSIEKAQTVDGMNFKKLSQIINDPKTHELAKKVFGEEQLKNIKSINEGSIAIESLLKQIPKSDKNIQQLSIANRIAYLKDETYKAAVEHYGSGADPVLIKKYATENYRRLKQQLEDQLKSVNEQAKRKVEQENNGKKPTLEEAKTLDEIFAL